MFPTHSIALLLSNIYINDARPTILDLIWEDLSFWICLHGKFLNNYKVDKNNVFYLPTNVIHTFISMTLTLSYLSICDLAVEGSPIKRTFMSLKNKVTMHIKDVLLIWS